MRIALGCDHAGWEMKEDLKPFLEGLGHQIVDFGTDNQDSVDYPDYALPVAKAVAKGDLERGIVICGTGIGSSIAANKVSGIRAALCHDTFTAEMSRSHNDANILCLGGRVIDMELARRIVEVWLNTPFSGGRHARRLKKIEGIEKCGEIR
ncbi:ribose 5-phosphate isomerase B [bacterium]|nr:ribose 5-phosphate isomerase B [bacterium]